MYVQSPTAQETEERPMRHRKERNKMTKAHQIKLETHLIVRLVTRDQINDFERPSKLMQMNSFQS